MESSKSTKLNEPFFMLFLGRRLTLARLFVFTFCVSTIIALAFNSWRESPNKLPTEQHVAASRLPFLTRLQSPRLARPKRPSSSDDRRLLDKVD